MAGMRFAGIDRRSRAARPTGCRPRADAAADAAGRRGGAARPRPWRPTARAWSDAAARRESGSSAAHSLRRGWRSGGRIDPASSRGSRRRVSTTSGIGAGRLTSASCGAALSAAGGDRSARENVAGAGRGEAAVTGGRGGTRRRTRSSSSAASAAIPGDGGKARGSSAGTRSMTVSRVSMRRTVADIGLAGDRRGEDDAAFFLQAHEAVAPGRLIGTDIVAGDRDETAAFGETRERRARHGGSRLRRSGPRHAARPRRAGSSAPRSAGSPDRAGRGSARRCAG